jgi:A/G-specific adenine glycosylase
MVPPSRAGDFAQALMDLGATICTPKRVNCIICPWTEDCAGRRRGIAGELPRRKAKAERPRRRGVAFWVERADGRVLLRERPDRGLLGGMMEVPSSEWRARIEHVETAAPLLATWVRTGKRVEHTFTHFHLELEIWSACVPANTQVSDRAARWVRKADLAGEALPSVMRKIIAAMDIPSPRKQSAAARGKRPDAKRREG